MDILIHTLSGTTTAAFIASFSKATTKSKLLLIVLGGFAGALPDIDAISLWSKFDATIGKLLHLNHSGSAIYFGKFWYSHHGFFHSFFAAGLLTFIFLLFRKLYFRRETWVSYFTATQTKILSLVFFFSYVSHLIGDLPTPGAVWGGIRLFFPFEIYVGGYGTTWWWNNYDVFLILSVTIITFITLLSFEKHFFRMDLIRMMIVFYVACIIACFYTVTHRSISYAYSGNTSRYEYYERTSKMDQIHRLGTRVYFKIEYLDKKFPFYF